MSKSNKLYFKTASLNKEAGVIELRFPYSINTFDQVKKYLSYKYVKKGKYCTIPLTLDNCISLKKQGWAFEKELKRWANKMWKAKNNTPQHIEIPGLKGTLLPYQEEGVIKIESFDGRALLADEMGLGKTIQAIAWMQLHREIKPVIIVCPSFLKLNWKAECIKWMPSPRCQILYGRKPSDYLYGNIIIINYDILHEWLEDLKKLSPQLIILDEAHYIKEEGTKAKPVKRTKAALSLCKGVPHIISITGTPIENKTVEIFTSIKIVKASLFPSKFNFKQRYCGAVHNGFGWTYNGSTKSEELHKILVDNMMVRRKKSEVLKDLPDKSFAFVPLDITNRKEYKQAEEDFIEFVRLGVELEARKIMHKLLEEATDLPVDIVDHKLKRLQDKKAEKAEKGGTLVQITYLKQLAAIGKLKETIEWIEEFINSGEKLVVFGIHKKVINEIVNHFGKIAVKVDGSVSNTKRHEVVKAFQEDDKIKLFVGNIKAAGVGLTLTAASNVAVVEYPDTPGALSQAIDRVHRLTQLKKVTAYFLTAIDTIEDRMARMLYEKQELINSVLDGKDADTNFMQELIESFKK